MYSVNLSGMLCFKDEDICKAKYGAYARGANCYCTPFDGCYHQHYQVKPQISISGTNGLHERMHQGVHDRDYFVEVTVTNRAMLQTTKFIKVHCN